MPTPTTDAPADIATIVRQVIAELSHAGSAAAPPSVGPGPVGAGSLSGAHGIFSTVDEAVRAAYLAAESGGVHFLGPLAEKVIRVSPPLIITPDEIEEAIPGLADDMGGGMNGLM